MNQELLRQIREPHRSHVREEWEKRDELLGVLDRALELATAAFVSGRAPEDLPDAPAADSDRSEWIEYFVKQGTLVYHEQLI